ncbi:MAG: type II CRISPR RNA-guided endonuclease Cas9, partial [Bacteroidales bacterium]
MKKTFGDWYLGLDVGTDSIGWAVTDKNYHIQKLNSKALWGSRLFPEAKPAAERRIFRSARRRNQRATQRIKWLQELFSQEICKVDPGFFQRMKESFFWEEDKTEHQKFSLFNDNTYTDKNYFKQFPTIYHLRAALLDPCQGPFDIRLVYLALHHIIKNRGHFLFDGDMESAPSFKPIFKEIVEYFQNLQEEETAYSFPEESIHQVGLLLSDRSLNRLEKSSKLMELLQVDKSNKSFKTLIEAMVGRKFSLSALFDDENLQNSECNKLCFADGNFADEKIPLLETELDEDRMYLVEKMFAAYDWALLADILDGQHFLSQAKVLAYKEHARQLKELKKVIKEYAPQKYNEVFRSPSQKDNYCCYIGSTMINAKKLSIEKKCNYDDFSKYIKTIIDNIAKTQNGCIDKNVQELLSLIERRELLPKLVTKDNCVIPHQLNCLELKAILKNASNYLPFLNEKDKEGLSVQEKIVSILNYRIPYFVGPLNGSHAQDTGRKFYWACKNSNDRIFPWNFNKVVNLEESAENFILRMTNKCTYLKGEDVLPKESLLYSKFTVLNELNNLRLDGEPITVALKQEIFLNLFLKEKKVTQKKLRNFLHINDNVEISGIDNDFKSSLKPYLDFAQYHDFSKQGDINNRLTEEQIENIIRWIVLFGNEKKILRAKIQKTYPETRFTSADIQYLSSLHYQKWGNFSASFLNLCAPDPHTSMEVSLVDMLWETNNNLMQLLGNDYSYSSMIEEFNNEEPLDKLSYSVVEELQVSPVVKRQIWQTLVIVRELTKVMGHAPLKVFVEMARKKDKKKLRKDPRKDKLKKLYEKCKEENAELLESLNQQPDGNLQQDALYLYYTQMGKCMYSGESIELEDLLSNSHIYDIDHIYPQSLVKDDSLDNRVLVKKTLNGIKSDDYPLSLDCQRKMFLFWKMLREKELISKEKFDRLTRTTELTSDELAGFIQRQLVETRQSTKAIANILKRFFADKSEIIYVKAGLVSDFRKAPPTGKEIKNGYSEEEIKKDALLKVREVNDLHHAKDAYLNIVVGNVYNTKFTSNPYNFINNAEKKRSYNLKRMFDFEVKRGDYSAWVPG